MDWSDEARAPLDSCLGCLACETACPSGVKYGEILERARERSLVEAPPRHSWFRGKFLDALTHPVALRLQLTLARVVPSREMPKVLAKLLSDDPPVARLPVARAGRKTREEPGLERVALLGGCVMEVVFPQVHEATERLLARVGLAAKRTKGCCGALHAHAGYLEEGRRRAERILEQAQGLRLVTNSAGCGSWLRKLAAPGAVVDATEVLAERGLAERLQETPGLPGTTATYHDACHLAHGQGVRSAPRLLLAVVPRLRTIDLPDSETCCGSAGIYNLLQPKMAAELSRRKWARIAGTGASLVLAGNPGCLAWLESSRPSECSAKVAHTLEALDWSFEGSEANRVGPER
jgi:glycolate oxidase iron-sulfur subunit